jgi:hypothetical protein
MRSMLDRLRPGDSLLQAIREQALQTRYVIWRENVETRRLTAKCTIVILHFVVGQFLFNYFLSPPTPVCT